MTPPLFAVVVIIMASALLALQHITITRSPDRRRGELLDLLIEDSFDERLMRIHVRRDLLDLDAALCRRDYDPQRRASTRVLADRERLADVGTLIPVVSPPDRKKRFSAPNDNRRPGAPRYRRFLKRRPLHHDKLDALRTRADVNRRDSRGS